MKPVVYNIGYQVFEIENFIKVLKANAVNMLIDVREKPYSRKKEFSKHKLKKNLEDNGISYRWMGSLLGGFTISKKQWLLGCEQVAKIAQSQTIVMMCVEDDLEKCHRKELVEILTSIHKVHNINLSGAKGR